METTKEMLEARVRETPLLDRLKGCRQRIGKMCSEGRPPRMCIPVQHDDDDFFISTTLADAQATVEALQAQIASAKHRCRCYTNWWAGKTPDEPSYETLLAQVEALQREHTQLQALVRAYGEAKIAFDSGRLREDHHAWKERFERLTTAEQALIATLDATTPDSNQLGDINDMVSKGGNGE